ncbi:MAG: signal peptidase I [Patescibacteria group bacterium]
MQLTDGSEKPAPKSARPKGGTPTFAQSPRQFVVELVKIVLIALAVIIPIRYFLFQPFYVRGASMEPNFYDSEYLIVDEITYRFSQPARGDVVVVKVPDRRGEFLIKRVIGLPGETVEIRDGGVYLATAAHPDGVLLHEPYLDPILQTYGNHKVALGPAEYYVLGDNRPVSMDSRVFGPLGRDYIVGRAWLRVWPFKDFQHFTAPSYGAVQP